MRQSEVHPKLQIELYFDVQHTAFSWKTLNIIFPKSEQKRRWWITWKWRWTEKWVCWKVSHQKHSVKRYQLSQWPIFRLIRFFYLLDLKTVDSLFLFLASRSNSFQWTKSSLSKCKRHHPWVGSWSGWSDSFICFHHKWLERFGNSI